jgi:SPP1 gp7 family putative phage head morphogenesis protein
MAKKSTFNNPDSQEREYTRLLRGYSKQLQRDVNAVLIPRLGQIKAEYEADLKRDSWIDTLALAMAELAALALYGANTVFQRLPGQFNAVSKFNEGQFKLVVKANTGLTLPPVVQGAPASALLGVNVFHSEPFLKPLAEGWIAENTSLIKSLPTKMHPELEGIIRRGVMNGESVKSLAAEIKARYGVTDARATLIAQDQSLKLNSDLTRYRLLSVGVKEYIWRTVGDSRVRDAHAARSGQTYDFDKGPPNGKNPGLEVRCRCRAEAVWPDQYSG